MSTLSEDLASAGHGWRVRAEGAQRDAAAIRARLGPGHGASGGVNAEAQAITDRLAGKQEALARAYGAMADAAAQGRLEVPRNLTAIAPEFFQNPGNTSLVNRAQAEGRFLFK